MKNIEESLPPQKEPVIITGEEYREYASLPIDDPKFLAWIAEKGITLNSGYIEAEIKGKKGKMDTSRKDFGRFVDNPIF